ncbi:hypothetical protein GCM10010218_53830 [Streptomyces mashuensis]|uniref:ATP-grasp domain-containing protein n=1 Tax=Streptomyces mashuensis TaxID=33904 RepID=A0A919B8P1_9ACTN|nr:ATP-grasp domain-containing protein [Streptomyces mashuensis]GHF65561.1 hypothetical protein GCM10010218_53830 [Streptomyces mashuensis]
MRVVVLGEFRADRLVAPLSSGGADVVVLGGTELGSLLGPDVACAQLPDSLSEQGTLRLLTGLGADVAVPNMGCYGQEQFLPVYAAAACRFRSEGKGMPAHPPGFAMLASDKTVLHRTARQRGWPVPQGRVCAEARAVREAVREIGLPVLVKEARSEFSVGRYYVRDAAHLDSVTDTVRFPVLVQQAVSGEEFGVELLTWQASTLAWPVASVGRLDGDCDPGRRVRVAPAALPAGAENELAATVHDIVRAFRPWGPWQIDFAVDEEGRLKVIELNGRLSGVSNMSWRSTGVDPHAAYARVVLGRPLPRRVRAARVVVELLVPNGVILPPVPAGLELTLFPGTPMNPAPCVRGYSRPVLGVPEHHADAAHAWLRALPPGTLLNTLDEAASQLDRGLRALRSGSTSLLA